MRQKKSLPEVISGQSSVIESSDFRTSYLKSPTALTSLAKVDNLVMHIAWCVLRRLLSKGIPFCWKFAKWEPNT